MMKSRIKKKATKLKEARQKLRYWQGQVRMDIKSLNRTIEKCKEIAKRMREIQKEA